MGITNIVLQEISAPSYVPVDGINNKSIDKPATKMDFNAVMKTLENPAAAEQPVTTKADDGDSSCGSNPKIVAESGIKEDVDDAEMLLRDEPKATEEQDENSELLTETVESLEAESNGKRAKESALPLIGSVAAGQHIQSLEGFEPKKEVQAANEPVLVMAKLPENKQWEIPMKEPLLRAVFFTDAKNKCEADNYCEQFEDLVLPEREITEFVQDSNLQLQLEAEPINFKQDFASQAEKLVHDVWQEADLAQESKVNMQNLQAEQPQALSAEVKKLNSHPLEQKDLDFEPEIETGLDQTVMPTVYDEQVTEEDGNSLDLADSNKDFEPYATLQNIQELNKANDGYYDLKTARVVTKQIAFSIEKAIAEIENSQPVKIQMSLTPKELGMLVINFVVEEGKIAMLTISASNQHTKELISRNMVMLQQELDKSGFEVKTVEVFGMEANNSGSSTESGQHDNQERQQEAYEHLLQKDFKHDFAINFGKRGEIA